MTRIIVPIYGSPTFTCYLNDNPSIRIEPWSRQVKSLRMDLIGDDKEEIEHIPDTVAIIEGDLSEGTRGGFQLLFDSGFQILPLIFNRSFFTYQIANENEVIGRSATPYSIDQRGSDWIRPAQLNGYLKIATSNLLKLNLYSALDLYYEIQFRTSAAQVQLLLYEVLLEHLSKKFIDPNLPEVLSRGAIDRMLDIALVDLIEQKVMDPNKKPGQCPKYNKIKENLTRGLSEKSNRKHLVEFLNEKCRLPVTEEYISRLVNMRAAIVHNRHYEMEEMFEVTSLTQYLCRVVLIEALTNFDEKFQRYMMPHTHRMNLLDWEKFWH